MPDLELSSWPSWRGAVPRAALWRTKGLRFLSLAAFLNHVIARPSSDLTVKPHGGYSREPGDRGGVIRRAGKAQVQACALAA